MDGPILLLVVIAAVAVAGFAKRLDLQVPLVLVTVGSIASFVPGVPHITLAPDLILGAVLPPLLYSAALDFSFVSFRKNLGHILRLGIIMVVVTTFAVGYFANWLVPELTLGAALVLGAVVAPPDAVAAVAVGRKLGLPSRMMAILTGESLVNDAAALTLFTLTVASVTGKKIAIDSPVLFFAYEIVGGVLIGLILARIVRFVRSRIQDSALETVLGLVLPFAAYLAAEEIHASGVLAVVTAGFVLGRVTADVPVTTRIQERQVWPTLDLLLEAFVFAYMGLQLKSVIAEVERNGLPVLHIFAYSLLILAVVIAVRPAWIFVNTGRRAASRKLLRRNGSSGTDAVGLTWRQNLVLSWAGMRGVVTLAAASGVPLVTVTGDPFPGRGVIQAVAFVVAVGTLLIQGLTLPMLIRRLDVADPLEQQQTEEQHALARAISRAAAETYLSEVASDGISGSDKESVDAVLDRVRRSVRARLEADAAEDHEERKKSASATFDRLRRNVLAAQRTALVKARDSGDLDDEVLREVLDGLDVEEAAAEARIERRIR
ncbi:Na+/H+ antiporter [Rhodococcus sp. BP-252]|uniref:Na+/H+ antiporter n=1 Tax=unclassified Rhodococcus (in: high G+C Gram-positive bacteria) TaxID=192944 RepID=UPI001C9A97D6|nr:MULTISPECIES: Na+/H+ antiporter [unclassified Rhodococcus (in: high G+C Gram-positive bacteria)]MBY6413103.1 Na+/H+ antiporter [Rhodococcus sp. BP-320]MBY6417734.1 Na+/H+ antiporter [Rhodococcus sp. BP-321]MBY6423884.1 Na+/H+ antiporter [Rhodococcus sp. BP-324]MBY6427845.1 Na+/H+ antiporter [Rhodococcus sp. BP-323]MBY6431844.1 Na+/H+ antiporter [Rhodococcus sp. BP-322]